MTRRTPTARTFATALAFAAVLATAGAALVSPASAHDHRRHRGHHHHHHQYYQYHDLDLDDAPYTRVVYRRHYRGAYAPFGFAHTYGRRVWVRAPFVNIYIRN